MTRPIDDAPAPSGHRAAPVWAILVVLALLPTAGMLAFAIDGARQRASTARDASAVADDVEDAVQVQEVVFALVNEQLTPQLILRGRAAGLSEEAMSDVVGYDLEARLRTSRAASDEAISALTPRALRRFPVLVPLHDDLRTLRTEVDGPEPDATTIYAGYIRAIAALERALSPQIDALLAGDRTTDPRTMAALHAFADATAAHFSSRLELLTFVSLAYDSEDQEKLLWLIGSSARYQRDIGHLVESRSETSRAAKAVVEAPATVRFDEAVQQQMRNPHWIREQGPTALARTVVDAYGRIELLMDVNRTAAQASVTAAGAAEAAAEERVRNAVALAAGLGPLTVALALVAAWSISRPLQLLSRWAGELTGGGLDAAAPLGRGPREVRTVSRALDEVAGNLRRVTEQTTALAVGALDDPVLANPLPGALGRSVQASVERLSGSLREQDALQARLVEQAHRDLLTGLPNRAGFLTAAEHALARAARSGGQIALISVALDGFKRANDSHGQAFGDEVLRTTAHRLVDAARGGDVVARLGGDEFAVLAEPVPGAANAVELAQRLREAVSAPVEGDGRFLRVTASVGVALNQDGHDNAADLLADADQAVQRAKRGGGDLIEVCDDALRADVAERHDIEAALRAAIPGGELELHYQPVVNTATGVLGGFEALVRWHRPGHGMVPPMAFIPIAEGSDLVIDLGRWVLAEAAAQLAAWSIEPALAHTHVAVNISGRHLLSKSIVDDVRSALERGGLAPERLVIEITETMVLSDLEVALVHLTALRQLGVRIALDDFGTGYTSIGQLSKLPVDVLKIDRSFIAELARRQDRSIVELLVEVAHTLELGLVAEGVEEADQLAQLQALDCDDVQGYFVSRPLPAADALAWALQAPHLEPGTDASVWMAETPT